MTTSSPDVRRARRAFLTVGVWIPLGIAAAGVAVMLALLPAMPDTIAIHWNAAGEPDGFAAAWVTPVVFAGVGPLLPLLIALLGRAAGGNGSWGSTQRFLAAAGLAATLFLTTMITWTFVAQRGLEDARDAPSALPALGVGAILAVVGGIAGWVAQPKFALGGANGAGEPAETLVLHPDERAAWLRTTTMAPTGVVVIGLATGLLAALAVVFGLTGSEVWWLLALLAVVLGALALTTTVFRVRVDQRGLRVASPLGVPRFGVPLHEVESVEVVRVTPVGDFGGWGLRLGVDGRFGIVLHAGPAIQVERRGARTLVVTVDDAATGAALLSALAGRDRP